MIDQATQTAPQGVDTTSADAPVQTQTVPPAAAPVPTPAPAPASAVPPVEGHTVSPEMTAEVQALLKAQEGQQALLKLRKAKEDACAADIQAVLAKHGCELIVGHQVKVSLATNPGSR